MTVRSVDGRKAALLPAHHRSHASMLYRIVLLDLDRDTGVQFNVAVTLYMKLFDDGVATASIDTRGCS